MSTEDAARDEVARVANEVIGPPFKIMGTWVTELLDLIREDGTGRMKIRAAEISLNHQARLQEHS